MYNRYINPAPVRHVGEDYPVRKLTARKDAASVRPVRYYHMPATTDHKPVLVNDHWEKQTIRTPEQTVKVSGTLHYSPAVLTADHDGYSFGYTFEKDPSHHDYTEGTAPALTDFDICAAKLVRIKLRSFARDGFTSTFQRADIDEAISAAKLALIEKGRFRCLYDGFSCPSDAPATPLVWGRIRADKDLFFAALRAVNNALRPRGMMSVESKKAYYIARLTRERAQGKNTLTDAQIEEAAHKHATVPPETITANNRGLPCAYNVRLRDRLIASINATVKRTPALVPFRRYAVLSVLVGYIAQGENARDAAPIDGRKQPALYQGIKRLVRASVASMTANNPEKAPID